jgi:hypothetical protein
MRNNNSVVSLQITKVKTYSKNWKQQLKEVLRPVAMGNIAFSAKLNLMYDSS